MLNYEMLIFIISRVEVERLSKKREWEQTSEYNTECMLFSYRTRDMKVT